MSSSFLMNSSPAAYPTAAMVDHKPFPSAVSLMDPLGSLDYGSVTNGGTGNGQATNGNGHGLHAHPHAHHSHHHTSHHHHQSNSYSLSDYYGVATATNHHTASNAIQSALVGTPTAPNASQQSPLGPMSVGGLVGQHHAAAVAAAAAAQHLTSQHPGPPGSIHTHQTHPSINSHHYGYHLNHYATIDQSPVPPPHPHSHLHSHPQSQPSHHTGHPCGPGPGHHQYGGNGTGGGPHSMATLGQLNSMTNSISSLSSTGSGTGANNVTLQQQHQQYFSSCSIGSPMGGLGGAGTTVASHLTNANTPTPTNHISPSHHQQQSPLGGSNLNSSGGHLSSRVSSPSLIGQRSPPSPTSSRNQSLGVLIEPPSPTDCAVSTASGSDSGTGGNGSGSGSIPVIYPWMKKVHVTPGKGKLQT